MARDLAAKLEAFLLGLAMDGVGLGRYTQQFSLKDLVDDIRHLESSHGEYVQKNCKLSVDLRAAESQLKELRTESNKTGSSFEQPVEKVVDKFDETRLFNLEVLTGHEILAATKTTIKDVESSGELAGFAVKVIPSSSEVAPILEIDRSPEMHKCKSCTREVDIRKVPFLHGECQTCWPGSCRERYYKNWLGNEEKKQKAEMSGAKHRTRIQTQEGEMVLQGQKGGIHGLAGGIEM